MAPINLRLVEAGGRLRFCAANIIVNLCNKEVFL